MSLESGVTLCRLNQELLPDPGSPMASTTTPLVAFDVIGVVAGVFGIGAGSARGCAVVASGEREFFWNRSLPQLPLSLHAVGFLIAFVLPLLAAFLLRGKGVVWNLGYALWVYVVSRLDRHVLALNLTSYALCAVAAIGLVMWGLQETRRERINLGIAGFAITIIVFYFSTVMGKLGRSASLIGFGVLFLVGGWQLEKLRRKLVARTKPAASAGGAA